MKKSISIVLVLSIIAGLFAMCGVTAFAEENNILDYITYEIDDYYGGVVITSCDPSISGDVVIPDTIEGYPVTNIDSYAFSECNEITSIYIPASVTKFSFGFSVGSGMEKIIVDENNEYYSSDESGVLYNKDKTVLIKYPCAKSDTEFVIPDSVTVIEIEAFVKCGLLENITIPETVTLIEAGAFEDCVSLKKVVVPDNVILGYSVFQGCTSLTEAVIGKSDSLSDGLFSGCVNLETVKINTREICAFEGCINLKNVELGDNVKRITMGAFAYCESLEEIYIPENVSEIETVAFFPNTNLKKIVVDEKNSFYASENGLLLSKDKTKLIAVPHGVDPVHEIPESVTTIGETAYYVFLDANIDLTGISVIEMGAFVNCFKQEELVVPESVTHINTFAFLSCNFIKDVYIYNPDVQLDEMCFGFSDFEVLIEKDDFVELSKKAYFSPDVDEREIYSAELDRSVTYYSDVMPISGLTIHGYEGSTAETYANENGFKFVPICRHNYVDTVITPATYTQAGEGGMVCEHCGDVQSTYEIPMLEIEDSEEKVDKDTGVSVVFPEGTFEGEAEIEVKPVEDGEAYKLISHKEGNYKVTMFDINVTVDGQKVQPNGTVLVQIPLPKGYNQNKCVVYYVADDGTMEELKTYHNKDGYVYFETDHFSYYAIIEDVEEKSDKNNNNNVANDFVAYLQSLLNEFINAFMNFITMIKSIFGMA